MTSEIVPPGRRQLAALLCIAISAFAIQRAATMPWGTVNTADGRRFELSAVGLSPAPVVESNTPLAASCRWWPHAGDASLCAVADGGETAFRRLRMSYPLLAVALWIAIAALFLQVLRIPRPAYLRAGATWLVAVLVAGATSVMITQARSALAVLAVGNVRFASTGLILALVATAGALASGWLHLQMNAARDAHA